MKQDLNNSVPNFEHKTVFLDEAIELLGPLPHKVFLDVTLGGGGHTKKLLEFDPSIKVIALDWDKRAIENAEQILKPIFGDRLELVFANFVSIARVLKNLGLEFVDGILADFGTSQDQIFNKDGFAFSVDSPLDMRMSNSHKHTTAQTILERATEEELELIFSRYGGEKFARPIAKRIVATREKNPILTTFELAKLVESVILPKTSRKITLSCHPATKVFQALRIAVNSELENIEHFLKYAPLALKPGGKLVCISFHSLEDRLVKNFFKDFCLQNPSSKIVTKKAIIPTEEQCRSNPSTRSAKMRCLEK